MSVEKFNTKLTKKQRLQRLANLLALGEKESDRLRRRRKPSEDELRKLAWIMAQVFVEAEDLKQPETLGRAYFAYAPFIAQIPLTNAGYFLLSEKMQNYDRCRRSCIKEFRNRTLRKLCISHCILVLLACLLPGESPN